jgi:hypothetical protein
VEALQTYVAAAAWRRRAVAIGESAAADMLRAWKIFSRDYDAGAVVATIQQP